MVQSYACISRNNIIIVIIIIIIIVASTYSLFKTQIFVCDLWKEQAVNLFQNKMQKIKKIGGKF